MLYYMKTTTTKETTAMARATSLDKFLDPNNPAFELNGYTVHKIDDDGRTTVFLLAPDLLDEAVKAHRETGRFPGGSNMNSVVGYVGRFDNDGSFIDGEFLRVCQGDLAGGRGMDTMPLPDSVEGPYVLVATWRFRGKPSFPTYKSLVSAAERQSPGRRAHERAEQMEAVAVAEARQAATTQTVRELPEAIPEIATWVFHTRMEFDRQQSAVRMGLESLIQRAQDALATLDAHPEAHIGMSAFFPDGRQISDLTAAVGRREQLLAVMYQSPFFPLFTKTEVEV